MCWAHTCIVFSIISFRIREIISVILKWLISDCSSNSIFGHCSRREEHWRQVDLAINTFEGRQVII